MKAIGLISVILAVVLVFVPVAGAQVPTVDDLLGIETVSTARISPDGKTVAFVVTRADFDENANIGQIWLADVGSAESFQLTRGNRSSSNPQWSPDGQWLTFTSSRAEGKNQIFAIRPGGGEAFPLTDSETGVGAFAWSRDGNRIAFVSSPESEARKNRDEMYGAFTVVRRDYSFRHVFTIDVDDALRSPAKPTQRTSGRDFNVGNFSWSPDGTRIAFSGTINPDLTQGHTSDIYVLDLDDDSVRKIVSTPGSDRSPQWSPDGTQIVFASIMGRTEEYPVNSRLALAPADGSGAPRSITDSFDENVRFVGWNSQGLFFSASQKTATHLFRVDPGNGRVERVSGPDAFMGGSFSFSEDGTQLALTVRSPTTLNEVGVTGLEAFAPRTLTRMTAQTSGLTLGTREVISWTSRDGATIEGVLIKPAAFDPSKKYALLTVIHGGPTGIDRPALLAGDTRYYPSDIWAARGALILKVNYRGSAGYGEQFRQLNVRNLGVGDAWDVLSGVDHLVDQGWVDPDRIGCMGWSQGGYISAFLTASSERFAAISVGAGISNWATYYYNTDITQFTINYLGDDPVDDPDIYEKTSPMAYIKNAQTPTLIQHGELDRRVPIPNGYELRQGLEDRGVPVEMVVYKGFGHGINKPRSTRAVMEHNLAWFNHFIFGDPMVDLTTLGADASKEKTEQKQ